MPAVLLHSAASPYSAKCRMAAAHLGLDVEFRAVKTDDQPQELLSANPLGKIPTLVLDDGFALFDSTAIMAEFDRLSGRALYPRNADKCRAVQRLEAAGNGLSDALVAQVYERKFRPADKIEQSWLDKQAGKANRMLDWLEANMMPVRGKLNAGQFAVAAALSYADLRFADMNWRRGRPKLKRFLARFEEACPSFATQKSTG